MSALFHRACLSTLLLICGCTPFSYKAVDAPFAETSISAYEPRPRIALVLGSGGPRGYAHIGVMRVLEDAGIECDLVIGSSVGALIGSFWANGYSAAQIDELSKQGGPLTLFDPSLFADRGWIHGQRLQDYVNTRVRGSSLESLGRRVIIATTRRADKTPVYFRKGNAGVAVRASSAMPGIFSPVGIGGVEYEDADESMPLAIGVARQAGAHFIIAVDVTAHPGSAPPSTAPKRLQIDAARRDRIEREITHADFIFHPMLDYAAGPWQSYFQHARAEGEAHARKLLPQLLESLRKANLIVASEER